MGILANEHVEIASRIGMISDNKNQTFLKDAKDRRLWSAMSAYILTGYGI